MHGKDSRDSEDMAIHQSNREYSGIDEGWKAHIKQRAIHITIHMGKVRVSYSSWLSLSLDRNVSKAIPSDSLSKAVVRSQSAKL